MKTDREGRLYSRLLKWERKNRNATPMKQRLGEILRGEVEEDHRLSMFADLLKGEVNFFMVMGDRFTTSNMIPYEVRSSTPPSHTDGKMVYCLP